MFRASQQRLAFRYELSHPRDSVHDRRNMFGINELVIDAHAQL